MEGKEILTQSLEDDQPAKDALQKTNMPIAIRNGTGQKILRRIQNRRQKGPESKCSPRRKRRLFSLDTLIICLSC